MVSLTHCQKSQPRPGSAWSEAAIASIGGALRMTQGQGQLAYHSPTADKALWAALERLLDPMPSARADALPPITDCPLVTEQDPLKAGCAGFADEAVRESTKGQYLKLYYNFCQFKGETDPGTWRIYHIVKFPDQATCEKLNSSADGFTDANVNAFGLTGKTVTITYGMGRNGDQNNFHLTAKKEVLAVYSDFASGWVEPRIGGYDVTFVDGIKKRKITINGLHAQGYTRKDPNVTDPSTILHALETLPTDQITTRIWDDTLASPSATDRLYRTTTVSQDALDAPAPLDVQMTSDTTTKVMKNGVIRLQENMTKVFGRMTITEDLQYTDSTCCWPREGAVESVFTRIFQIPSDANGQFDREVVTFVKGNPCGSVSVQHFNDKAAQPAQGFQLSHCQ